MGSTAELWYVIEEAFQEVEELCKDARAAELALELRKRDEAAVRLVGQGRTAALAEEAPKGAEERYPSAVGLARDVKFRERHPNGANFVELRAKMRSILVRLNMQLQGMMASGDGAKKMVDPLDGPGPRPATPRRRHDDLVDHRLLPEHEVHYVLFPIVVHFDELARLVSRGATDEWEPLQSELYDVDNGGELFYVRLEERLQQKETPSIVFEVFYFCLRNGFLGKLSDDPKRVEDYLSRLDFRLHKAPIQKLNEGPAEVIDVHVQAFPYKYYLLAAAAVVGLYALLSFLGYQA